VSSESESDESSQRKHFMKAPVFDGSSMPFETFYAKFQICAKYNRWSRSEQLAFLSASLTRVDKLMQRFDKSLQALQSRVAQLEESKRDTVPAPKLDSKPQASNRPSSGKTKCFDAMNAMSLDTLQEVVRSGQVNSGLPVEMKGGLSGQRKPQLLRSRLSED